MGSLVKLDTDFALKEFWRKVSNFLAVRSVTTQDTYCGILHEWCTFLKGEWGGDNGARVLLGATDSEAVRYRSWLSTRLGHKPRAGGSEKLSNATIAKKLGALRKFYSVLATCGLRSSNPFSRDLVPPPSENAGRKRPTEMIEFGLVQKLIDAPDTTSAKGRRDRALLVALFGGGLRRSEAVKLKLRDFKTTQSGASFLALQETKNGRDAQQAIPNWASDLLNAWTNERRAQGAADEDYLFPNYTGRGGLVLTKRALSANGLYKVFKAYAKQVGAGDTATPHSARATAITKLLSDGVSYRAVQDFSRHSTVTMVERYDKRRTGVETSAARALKY